MAECVLVTEWEYKKAESIFKSANDLEVIPVATDEESLATEIIARNCRAIIIGVDPYTGLLYEALGKTGSDSSSIIARFGVGHDNVDKTFAHKNNIIVTNTPGVLDDSVAEQSIWLMGCLARQIPLHDKNMKTGLWEPGIGNELKNKKLLVVGCGNIGRKVAKIASFGFGMDVIAYDVMPQDIEELREKYGISSMEASLDTALPKADFVSINLPSIEETKHFVNEEFLSKMKETALLINTSRGPIVDERAVYKALKEGQIAGVGLDVFEHEPYEPLDYQKDIRKLENIVLTPHVGSSTKEACNRMAVSCLDNISAFLKRDYKQLNIVNPEILSG